MKTTAIRCIATLEGKRDAGTLPTDAGPRYPRVDTGGMFDRRGTRRHEYGLKAPDLTPAACKAMLLAREREATVAA